MATDDYTRYRFYKAQGMDHNTIAGLLDKTPADLANYVGVRRTLQRPGRPLERVIIDGGAVCRACKKPKHLEEFYSDSSAPGGISYNCKACTYTRKTPPSEDYLPQYRALVSKLGVDKAKEHLTIAKRRVAAFAKAIKEKSHE